MATYKIDYRTSLGRLVKVMKEDCKRVVEEAINTNEFTNRTNNLEDSYGCAVYYNGQLLRDTLYYKEPIATNTKLWYKKEKSGHKEMLNYFETFRPRKRGLTMVLVAAMPYGEILETGGGYLRRKYKVIVGANGLMRELAAKYDGMFGRRRGGRTSINVERI